MKLALPLILTMAFALNACTTLANRRDLYSPGKASGPNTDKLHQTQQTEISNTHYRISPH